MQKSILGIKLALDSAIKEVSSQHRSGKEFSRQSQLTQETMIRLLIGAEGGSLAKVLHAAGIDVSPSACSQRRAQISPDVFHQVLVRFNDACHDRTTFHGYRVLAVDGSSINMPRNPNAPSFVYNESTPSGYNQLHLNPLYDVCNKTFFDAVIQPEPQNDEIGALIEMTLPGREPFL